MTRVCRMCGEAKTPEEFARDRSRSDGLMTRCKVCNNAHSREWQLKNRERYLARLKRWSEANGDEKRAKDREWRAANRDEINARRRARETAQSPEQREARLERHRASSQTYSARNRARLAAKNRQWHEQRSSSHGWRAA